ncbi:uncharacterized protein LOC122793254 [Protopterus annectens]|uniref:uncharacterized protein LOC122793254 n=1 Tax=Protopterus annectens TaxID=7888 RepID=UPI001CF984B0|nr:uncharacterized protein LOC122793254 [Protopterus annectens]
MEFTLVLCACSLLIVQLAAEENSRSSSQNDLTAIPDIADTMTQKSEKNANSRFSSLKCRLRKLKKRTAYDSTAATGINTTEPEQAAIETNCVIIPLTTVAPTAREAVVVTTEAKTSNPKPAIDTFPGVSATDPFLLFWLYKRFQHRPFVPTGTLTYRYLPSYGTTYYVPGHRLGLSGRLKGYGSIKGMKGPGKMLKGYGPRSGLKGYGFQTQLNGYGPSSRFCHRARIGNFGTKTSSEEYGRRKREAAQPFEEDTMKLNIQQDDLR